MKKFVIGNMVTKFRLSFVISVALMLLLFHSFFYTKVKTMVSYHNKIADNKMNNNAVLSGLDFSRGAPIDWHVDKAGCPPIKDACNNLNCKHSEYASFVKERNGCSICRCINHMEL